MVTVQKPYLFSDNIATSSVLVFRRKMTPNKASTKTKLKLKSVLLLLIVVESWEIIR